MRRLVVVLGLVLLAVSGFANALQIREGQQYLVLTPPRPTEAPADKIEVTEFFWYGCSHCNALEPDLEEWVARLPKDVKFRRVPAVFPGKDGKPGNWAPMAQLYYALEAMGVVNKLHGDIFYAIHVDRINLLADPKVLSDWLASKGVDRKKFLDTYNSFAVQSKVLRSQQLSQQYGFDGVPSLFVDGRYTPVAHGEAGSHADIFPILDQLIDKVRKERARK